MKDENGGSATENTEATEAFVVGDDKPRRATHVLNQKRHPCGGLVQLASPRQSPRGSGGRPGKLVHTGRIMAAQRSGTCDTQRERGSRLDTIFSRDKRGA
jgi:hypothetical protein